VVAISISPTSATVGIGQTQQFTATVTGTSNTTVTWSVVEGSSWGSVSSSGLYTASESLPSPATATVRATSVADPSKHADAQVTLTRTGPPAGFTEVVQQSFGIAPFATNLARSELSGVVYVVFTVSNLNAQLTLTGTYDCSGGQCTYSQTPSDKLVYITQTGNQIELTISAFEGNMQYGSDNFLDFHTNVSFRIVRQGADLEIQSSSVSPTLNNPSLPNHTSAKEPMWYAHFQRRIKGIFDYNGVNITVDLSTEGDRHEESEMAVTIVESKETLSGSASSSTTQFMISQQYEHSFHGYGIVTGNSSYHALSNTFTLEGVTYSWNACAIRMHCSQGLVENANLWLATGTITSHTISPCNVQFSHTPIDTQSPPYPVVSCAGLSPIKLTNHCQ
jgi:hypothetical protein